LKRCSSLTNMRIYATWKSPLGEVDRARMKTWEDLNPGSEVDFFDDSRMERWMEWNVDTELQVVFRSIIAGPAKADLWRYCILYLRGGCYVDVDCRCVAQEWLGDIRDIPFVSCMDHVEHGDSSKNVFQGFIYVRRPRHPVLLSCINRIRRAFRRGEHQNDIFSFSGPRLMGSVLRGFLRSGRLKEGTYGEAEGTVRILRHYGYVDDRVSFQGRKLFACQEAVTGKPIQPYGPVWRPCRKVRVSVSPSRPGSAYLDTLVRGRYWSGHVSWVPSSVKGTFRLTIADVDADETRVRLTILSPQSGWNHPISVMLYPEQGWGAP